MITVFVVIGGHSHKYPKLPQQYFIPLYWKVENSFYDPLA